MSPAGGLLGPLLLLAMVLFTDLWVYFDARDRWAAGRPVVFAIGSITLETPTSWFVACLVLWVLFLPLYVTRRNEAG